MKLLPYERTAFYYETDQMGVVHHSNYIRWMEEARIHMLDQLGLNYQKMEELGIIIPVLSASCEYKIAVHFNDSLQIISHLDHFNGVKFFISYKFIKDGNVHATGKSSHCFLDRSFHPIRLKKLFPDIYETFQTSISSEE